MQCQNPTRLPLFQNKCTCADSKLGLPFFVMRLKERKVSSIIDDIEKIIEKRFETASLEDMHAIACHICATMPDVPKLDKRMQSPRCIGSTSACDQIADMIMHRLLFREWKECKPHVLWQMAFRLQYAYDTIGKFIEYGEERELTVFEACAHIAILAAYTYNENAASWLACVTTVEEVTHDVSPWPTWVDSDNEHIQKLLQRYATIIQLSKQS